VVCSAFFIFSFGVAIGLFKSLDLTINSALESIWWPPLWPFFEAIAVAGGIEVTTLVAAGLLLFLLWRRLWRAALALLAFPIGLLLEVVAKHLVSHGEPPVSHAGRLSVTTLVQGPVNSFPSGHVVRSIIVYGLVALTVHRLAPGRPINRVVMPVVGLLVISIAFDRLYLAVHWMSDVVGGGLLAALSLSLVWLWQGRSALAGSELDQQQ
jgi:undecaprenyl-diphosphatase